VVAVRWGRGWCKAPEHPGGGEKQKPPPPPPTPLVLFFFSPPSLAKKAPRVRVFFFFPPPPPPPPQRVGAPGGAGRAAGGVRAGGVPRANAVLRRRRGFAGGAPRRASQGSQGAARPRPFTSCAHAQDSLHLYSIVEGADPSRCQTSEAAGQCH